MINPKVEADLKAVDDIKTGLDFSPSRAAALALVEIARNLVMLRGDIADMIDAGSELREAKEYQKRHGI